MKKTIFLVTIAIFTIACLIGCAETNPAQNPAPGEIIPIDGSKPAIDKAVLAPQVQKASVIDQAFLAAQEEADKEIKKMDAIELEKKIRNSSLNEFKTRYSIEILYRQHELSDSFHTQKTINDFPIDLDRESKQKIQNVLKSAQHGDPDCVELVLPRKLKLDAQQKLMPGQMKTIMKDDPVAIPLNHQKLADAFIKRRNESERNTILKSLLGDKAKVEFDRKENHCKQNILAEIAAKLEDNQVDGNSNIVRHLSTSDAHAHIYQRYKMSLMIEKSLAELDRMAALNVHDENRDVFREIPLKERAFSERAALKQVKLFRDQQKVFDSYDF